MSKPAEKPSHVVPASVVMKVKQSTPELVNDGSVPPAQSTAPGQTVPLLDAPLVRINVKEQALPVAEGLSNV